MSPVGEGRLTGRVRHRTGWRGRLVLQVQYVDYAPHGLGVKPRLRWRDGRTADLSELWDINVGDLEPEPDPEGT